MKKIVSEEAAIAGKFWPYSMWYLLRTLPHILEEVTYGRNRIGNSFAVAGCHSTGSGIYYKRCGVLAADRLRRWCGASGIRPGDRSVKTFSERVRERRLHVGVDDRDRCGAVGGVLFARGSDRGIY